MRLIAFLCSVALFAAGALASQDSSTAKKKSSTSKSKAAAKSRSTNVAHKTTAAPAAKPQTTSKTNGKTPPGRRASSKKSKPAVTARRSTQQQPTPERYQQIQSALAARGYFKSAPDGTWGPESVDALKRFQRDQNLTEDGKIGSLSLIALGLGPKRTAAAEPPVEKQVQQR